MQYSGTCLKQINCKLLIVVEIVVIVSKQSVLKQEKFKRIVGNKYSNQIIYRKALKSPIDLQNSSHKLILN